MDHVHCDCGSNGPFAFDVTHEFWGGNFKNGITSPTELLHAFPFKFLLRSKLLHVSFLLNFTMKLCKGFVCNETLRKLLMRHAKSRFSIFGGATSGNL